MAEADPTAEEIERGQNDPSVSDLLNEDTTQQYIKGIAGTMAATGVSFGVIVVLLGMFGGPELTIPGAEISSQQYKLSLANSIISQAPLIGVAIAAVSGFLLGREIPNNSRKAMVAAGAGSLIGMVLLVILTDVIISTQIPSFQGQTYSLNYGTAIMNGIAIGIGAAVAAAGAAYATNEYLPN